MSLAAAARAAGLAARRTVFALLPHHLLSTACFRLARIEQPAAKDALIALYRRVFPVRMEEAQEEDPRRYPTLDAFFTRALKPAARPWTEGAGLACPCDGTVGACGAVDAGALIQAKGQAYSAAALLGSHDEARLFDGGQFATLYLSPRDCHRVFMPCDGARIALRHIPGRLYSVAPWAAARIPGLYTRNERVVSLFEDAAGAAFAVVMVGALHVGSIEIAGHGLVAPRRCAPTRWPAPGPRRFARGEELGRFHLGSTVVLLAAPGPWRWHAEVAPGRFCAYGQMLLAPEAAP